MSMKSDIEIAQEHIPQRITEIAAAAGIDEKYRAGRQADSGHRHHSHPRRRGQDHYLCGPG